MLPTRFYYEEFTDTLRLWINETSTPQAEIRQGFDREIKDVLRSKGIDIRDRALTVEAARNAFYEKEMLARRQNEWKERMN